jgi:hypothetical protein
MAKVRCKVCQNEFGGTCSVKKVGIAKNKPRRCDAFILAESKVKEKQKIPTERIGYTKYQELKAEAKAQRKALIKMLKEGVTPGDGTAKNLGLVEDDSRIIMPGDSRFKMPDNKHPLTGDLSRFKTSAQANVKPENTHASKLKMS